MTEQQKREDEPACWLEGVLSTVLLGFSSCFQHIDHAAHQDRAALVGAAPMDAGQSPLALSSVTGLFLGDLPNAAHRFAIIKTVPIDILSLGFSQVLYCGRSVEGRMARHVITA